MKCPIPECDYEADGRSSVVAHVQGKSSDGHAGIGYYQAQSMLEGGGDDTGPTSGFEAGETAASGTVVDDLPNPETDAGTGDEPAETGACPDCGSDEYHAADEYLEAYGSGLKDAQRTAVKTHDRVCSACGEVYDV